MCYWLCFWFNSYFHITVTTQSGSCSKRTHLCHHMASRVDTALLICALGIFSALFAQTRAANKRASMFTNIEPVQICAFQTCQRRGCKNSARHANSEEWRHRLPRTAPRARRVATSNACVSRNGTRGGQAGVAATGIAATYGSNGAEQRRGIRLKEAGLLLFWSCFHVHKGLRITLKYKTTCGTQSRDPSLSLCLRNISCFCI